MKSNIRTIIMISGTVLFLLAVFSYPQKSYANPPQSVTVSYDSSSQNVTVRISHKSSATGFHYIKYVEIKKNGTVVSNNTYNNQPDQQTFTYMYKLSASEGDKLEVTASCSLWGHKTATLILGQAKQ